MREIKFRGKRVDNGEWIYGYIKKTGSEWWILNETTDWDSTPPLGLITQHKFKVIPESVGQYTGLKDKDDAEVYGGDIFDVTTQLYTNFGKTPTGRYDTTYLQVIWKEDGWAVKTLLSETTVVGSESKGLRIPAKYGVVIGSIYDKELLEVQP